MMRIFLRFIFMYSFLLTPSYFFAAAVKKKPTKITLKKTPQKGSPVAHIMDLYSEAEKALPNARKLVNGKISSFAEYQAAENALDIVEEQHNNLTALYNSAVHQKGTLVGRLSDVSSFLTAEAKEIPVLKDTLKRKLAELPKPKAREVAPPAAPVVIRERVPAEVGISPEEAARRENQLRLRLQQEFDEQQRRMRDRYEHELQTIRNQLAETERVIAQERRDREQQELMRNKKREQEREQIQRNLERANAERDAAQAERRRAQEHEAVVEREAREREQRAVQAAVTQAIAREKAAHERDLAKARALAPAQAPEKQALLAAQEELARLNREREQDIAAKNEEIDRIRAQFEQERTRLTAQADDALRAAVAREKDQSRLAREAAQRAIQEVGESLKRFEIENAAELANAREQISRLQAELRAAQSRERRETDAAAREKEQLLVAHSQELARLQRDHERQREKDQDALRAATAQVTEALDAQKAQAKEIERLNAVIAQEREKATERARAQQAQFEREKQSAIEQEKERLLAEFEKEKALAKQQEAKKIAEAAEKAKQEATATQQQLIEQARAEQQNKDQKERKQLEERLAQLERERASDQEKAAREALRLKSENETLLARIAAIEHSNSEKQAAAVEKEHLRMQAQIDTERRAMEQQLEQERKQFEQQLKEQQIKIAQLEEQLARKTVQEERQAQKAAEQELAVRQAQERQIAVQKQVQKLQDLGKQVQFYRGLEKAQRAKKALSAQYLEQSQTEVNRLVDELLRAQSEQTKERLNAQLIRRLDALGESAEAAKIRQNALQRLERGIEQEEVSLAQTLGTMIRGIGAGAKGAPAEQEIATRPVVPSAPLTPQQEAELKRRKAEREKLLQQLTPQLREVLQRVNATIDSLAHASENEKPKIMASLEKELSRLGDSPQEIAIREEAEERLKEAPEATSILGAIGSFLRGIASKMKPAEKGVVVEPELGAEFGAWGRAPELESLFAPSRPAIPARPVSPPPAAAPSRASIPFPIHEETEVERLQRERKKTQQQQREQQNREEQSTKRPVRLIPIKQTA
ncbi:MAG TPA: hypothetical protein VFF04_01865 [Candidatus Babeliales bacterium]|nr:hypothetical protein [Candidatus Babeliales bacterium]